MAGLTKSKKQKGNKIFRKKFNQKVVFAGPFVGEFGWELLFWHGWVKKLFRTRYKNYYKIVSSVPGRHIFYPDADEFWPIPKSFFKKPFSSRGYITDSWINGWPKSSKSRQELEDVYPRIQRIISDFKKKLPRDAEIIIPWERRIDPEYGVMGSEIPENPKDHASYSHEIGRKHQIFEYFKPTKEGKNLFEKIRGNDRRKLICIFPRMRKYRRPDKNWTKEKYLMLIEKLKKEFPEYKVAILGEPGGAFFSDRVPNGCIDLINVPADYRMDIQCAALNESVLSIGSQSGAIDFALASGCPALSWGLASGEKKFLSENYMESPMTFIPIQNPSEKIVFMYSRKMLGKGSVPVSFELKKRAISGFYWHMPKIIMNSKKLSIFRKKLSNA